MPSSATPSGRQTLRRQVAVLTKRVALLERAIQRKDQKSTRAREHDAFLRARGVKPRQSDAKRFATLLAQEKRATAKPRNHRSSQELRTSNDPTSQITQTEPRIAGAKTRNH